MLLKSFLSYLELEKRYSKHTVTAYQKDIEQFLTFLSTESLCSLEEAQAVDVRRFLAHLAKESTSERTINRKLSSLKSFYRFLVKTGTIHTSPVQNLKSLKQPKKAQVPFTSAELDQLLDAQDVFPNTWEGARDALMIDLLYQTGMRRSELISLQVNDLQLTARQIKVLGKRNKQRMLPITNEMSHKIKNYLQLTHNQFSEPKLHVFVTKKGKPLYPKLVYNVVNTYLSVVSSKTKKSPHMLRHTFATQMLQNGADINAVKELLGHSSLAATQVYTHQDIQQLKKVFNRSHPREAKNQ